MAENTKIQWTDHTFNPWIGCTKVSPGCDHCYAEHLMDGWLGRVKWGPGQPRKRTSAANWLILTKRVGNAIGMAPAEGLPANGWLGATVVNQEEAERDIPKLLATPAAVRFLSIEPVLGDIDLRQLRGFHNGATPQTHDCLTGHSSDTPWGYVRNKRPDPYGRGKIDWVIVGGESGPQARSTNIEWIRSIVQQCQAAQVPVFVKQLGARAVTTHMFDLPTTWAPDMSEPVTLALHDSKGGDPDEWPEDLRVRELPHD